MDTPGFPPKKRGWPAGKPRGPRKKRVQDILDRDTRGTDAPSEKPNETKQGWSMAAMPNWESQDLSHDGDPDRLKIPREKFPPGLDLQWVTKSVYGQEMPTNYNTFVKGGWTPVHGTDGDGRFDGMFMPKGYLGPIEMDGLILMCRPMELTQAARRRELADAREQIAIKERAMRSGDIGVKGSDHESALRTNKISKSIEEISIPKNSKE